jgi:inosose dehydratase
MTIRIGAGPIGWFEDDFSAFRNDIVREAHLTALARAGFDGICLNPGSAREVAAVRASLARHRLQFIAPTHAVSILTSTAVATFAGLKQSVRAARALGATDMTLCDRSTGDITHANWDRLSERLSDLGAAFKSAGVQLVYRPVAGTIVGSAEVIDRLMAATDATVGLMLDASVLGDRTVAIARRHGPRIAIIAPESATDAVMAELPHFQGWTMLDEHAGHAMDRVKHVHELADMAEAA